MPQPSSATTEEGERRPVAQRGLEGEEIHSAKRGVIFHRTDELVVYQQHHHNDWR